MFALNIFILQKHISNASKLTCPLHGRPVSSHLTSWKPDISRGWDNVLKWREFSLVLQREVHFEGEGALGVIHKLRNHG